MAAGHTHIEIDQRDVDVPLSSLGEEQARALGQWFAKMPQEQRPDLVLTSPYVRAYRTGQIICEVGGLDPSASSFVVDERLREKEFGILDRLTTRGIEAHFPDQYEFRRLLGKFYHRPPGGESWCDVILRLRSLNDTLTRNYRGDRVLIVTHQVVVNCLRYLFERLDESRILAIDRTADVPNCSLTSYVFDPRAGKQGKLVLDLVNFVLPLEQAGTPLTVAADQPATAKP